MRRICDAVYLVGGGNLSAPSDCLCYALDLGVPVLIDCGAGSSWPRIAGHMRDAGLDPQQLDTLVLTHCHVDHIGAAARVKDETGCRIVCHALDREAIESGDPTTTAASWYGVRLKPLAVDHVLDGKSEQLAFPGGVLTLIHTPGHTPGSMVGVLETADDHRVLFGQDIHGPFSADFGSDIRAWRASMRDLIALDADILCEGHYGVFEGVEAVREFIEQQLSLNA